ncbi:MAG TPA: DNA polymerase III subunit chi [Thiobacillaceae bacterium]|nr:DNA polymerase III subunit chi [Thiobacillaceae bacterium]HNA83739.1 DNA polymerase III subunit chi [Thiobacillaceae bacterium]HNF89851.1 DNA polymerase III subunit chi [Thiobacillaceae bacterium]HNH90661.1 DNA polymerase III subunit chi [Thiobacillaceae bacterium]HNI08457.1 DNA polymerase III subunit chi [Thiobacillaceae bacterium]
MTRVDFYFNAPAKAEVARKLATKTFLAGQQALVYSRQAQQCQTLDGLFWTAQQLSFLPHVRCGHPLARETPILIGDDPDELASADVLINLEDETPAFFGRFARVLEIVTLDEADRERARVRLRFFRERGYQVDTHDLTAP